MHLLATEVATLEEAAIAVDLSQSPADVVVLSFSDSDLSVLAAAAAADAGNLPSLRLARLKQLRHPMSVDLYLDRTLAHARAVIVRCLGGLDYWRYGIERIAKLARTRAILFAALPGDDRADPRLAELSTASPETLAFLDKCFRHGGRENVRTALRRVAVELGHSLIVGEPAPVPPAALLDGTGNVISDPARLETAARPSALVVFYRASLTAADFAPVTALTAALDQQGLAPLAVAVTSLKDPAVAPLIADIIARTKPSVILNCTAFSALRDDDTTVLDAADAPVLQVVLSSSQRQAWQGSTRGLSPTDLAMNVVLPELDGRLLTRAISFKAETPPDDATECARVVHAPDGERTAFVAKQAARWARLRNTAPSARRIAIVLSDYPDRGGRTGYAVGLDTADSVVEICAALNAAGYDLGPSLPQRADVERLLTGDVGDLAVPFSDYKTYCLRLPATLQAQLQDTWNETAADPAARAGAFHFPSLRLGNVTVLLQPDRGSISDRKATYHDTSVPPRHAYVALYAHLREAENIDALVHLGTHGTLEWLPGKALVLSSECWPEAVLGPLPVIYPFIVNNPGEAAQAKRRISAVTIGHLTPPLVTAGLHGGMADLENLIDEYAEADGVDARRLRLLEDEIVARAWGSGLAVDCGVTRDDAPRAAIAKLDAQLCDIKELAIRDRLHVFGRVPECDAAHDLETAIAAALPLKTDVTPATIAERVRACAETERAALLAALDGRRVAAGPSGAPTRGRLDVLPTGRNLTSVDPRALPTRTAAAIGTRAADEVIRRYLQDHGEYPRALMMDLWASASLRTGGDDLAHALHYLGARPVWDAGSNRVTGIEVIPLAKLGRPRIDVTLRISGLFRDLFETQITLFDLAVRQIAARDEDDADNPLAAAHRNAHSLVRIFGGAPGTYGAGTAAVALDGHWQTRADLGHAYIAAGATAYGASAHHAPEAFADRIAASDALVHPQDDRERDVLDGDGIADFAGGFASAAHALGSAPSLYHIDTSRPDAPKARSLPEEIARIVRGRLTNPRWIAGMLRHGHRGAAEVAQGVDALYAFAATANAVPAHLFDAALTAIVADQNTFDALAAANPAAARAILDRLNDARARGLWPSRLNAVDRELHDARERLTALLPAPREAAQ